MVLVNIVGLGHLGFLPEMRKAEGLVGLGLLVSSLWWYKDRRGMIFLSVILLG